MTLDIKYSIGDTVWALARNTLREGQVEQVNVIIKKDGKTEIMYYVVSGGFGNFFDAEYVASTKEELKSRL